MDNRKILVLLTVLVVFINVKNHFISDKDKLNATISLLEQKIEKEKSLSKMQLDKKSLQVEEISLFFSDPTYSAGMGRLQKMVQEAADGFCGIRSSKWAQVATSNIWYEHLTISLSLECTPKNFFRFINNLRKNKKIIAANNLRVAKPRKKSMLVYSMQLRAMRLKEQDD